jgi:hypothetical protein
MTKRCESTLFGVEYPIDKHHEQESQCHHAYANACLHQRYSCGLYFACTRKLCFGLIQTFYCKMLLKIFSNQTKRVVTSDLNEYERYRNKIKRRSGTTEEGNRIYSNVLEY